MGTESTTILIDDNPKLANRRSTSTSPLEIQSKYSFQHKVKPLSDISSSRQSRSKNKKITASSKDSRISTSSSKKQKQKAYFKKKSTSSSDAMYVTIPWASVDKPHVPDNLKKEI